jgi:ribosomal protein L11 methyltransferase
MKQTHIIEIQSKYKYLPYIESFFEGMVSTISSFEDKPSLTIDPQPEDVWLMQAYFLEPPAFEHINKAFRAYAEESDLEILSMQYNKIDNLNFAQKVLEDFKPISIGRFYIHNSAHKVAMPTNMISMEISSGLAFGTGEHETTSGCLEFIADIKDLPTNVLDMGTGSGILSIAAAKFFQCKVTASDIEENAIATARQNFALNNVSDIINLYLGDGYTNDIQNHGPYDLIVSNILARPLISMSQDLVDNLKIGGIAILAGFLLDQAEQVIAAHTSKGLELIGTKNHNNWIIAQLIRIA